MRRALAQANRVQAQARVSDELLRELRRRVDDRLAEVDDRRGRAVHDALLVLPHARRVVLAALGDVVDDVLGAADELLREHRLVHRAAHVDRPEKRLEVRAGLCARAAARDAVGPGALGRLEDHVDGRVAERVEERVDVLERRAQRLLDRPRARGAHGFLLRVLVAALVRRVAAVARQAQRVRELVREPHARLGAREDRGRGRAGRRHRRRFDEGGELLDCEAALLEHSDERDVLRRGRSVRLHLFTARVAPHADDRHLARVRLEHEHGARRRGIDDHEDVLRESLTHRDFVHFVLWPQWASDIAETVTAR